MNRLIELINIPQVSHVPQLETSYKQARTSLKKMLKSLERLKKNSKNNYRAMSACVVEMNEMSLCNEQNHSKESALDYYIFKSGKVFKKMSEKMTKPTSQYEKVKKRAKLLVEKISSFLEKNKAEYLKLIDEHEKLLKRYGEKCYPESSSLLYLIGIISNQSLAKTDDPLLQETLREESGNLSFIIEDYIKEMQSLEDEAISLGREYFIGLYSEWKEMLVCMIDFVGKEDIMEREMKVYGGTVGTVHHNQAVNDAEEEEKDEDMDD